LEALKQGDACVGKTDVEDAALTLALVEARASACAALCFVVDQLMRSGEGLAWLFAQPAQLHRALKLLSDIPMPEQST
jgi:hypothetical protein